MPFELWIFPSALLYIVSSGVGKNTDMWPEKIKMSLVFIILHCEYFSGDTCKLLYFSNRQCHQKYRDHWLIEIAYKHELALK